MANLKQIKAKIKSVSNLKKITRALEVVSTVKLQKIKSQAEGLKLFLMQILTMLSQVGQHLDVLLYEGDGPTSTASTRQAVIVVTSERGLCGGLNTKLLRKVTQTYDLSTTDFFVVGKKGLEYLKRVDATIVGYINTSDKLSQAELTSLFFFFDEALTTGAYRTVHIAYNYFKNSIMQLPVTMQLFPLAKDQIHSFFSDLELEIPSNHDIDHKDLLIEPDLDTLRTEVRRQIRNYIIMSAIVQNKTGEHASRMIAMKNAKDNATGFVNSLTLKFNKERQGAITEEISEIVSAKIAIEG